MVYADMQNMVKHFLIFLFLSLVLMIGVPKGHADGERPFKGMIRSISKGSISVMVTKEIDAKRNLQGAVDIFITKDTRIFNGKLKKISLRGLSAGDLVSINPYTQLNGDIEADMIHMARRNK